MKHSLVIGGTRGIGKAIAARLTASDMTVSIVGRSTASATELVTRHGPLSNLIFCQRYRGTEDVWLGELETSLTLTKSLIDLLAPSKFALPGSIVIVSSQIANTVADEQPVGYHVAKAGLENMARFYAVKLGKHGIRVNCVAPGVTLKPENCDYYTRTLEGIAKAKMFDGLYPLGGMTTADDVAEVVWAICYHMPRVTGAVIPVDGGAHCLNQESVARRKLWGGNLKPILYEGKKEVAK